ncbi:MAG: type II secretion system protein N [Candidatus Rokuibacteriota bacterium]
MTRRLLVLIIGLGLLVCFVAAALTRELLATHPLPAPPAPRAARLAAVPAAPASPSAPASYGVIATKNLFSPSRSETPAGPVVAADPRPLLHGVVMDGAKSRAYLEDPQVKRTFGYAVGDPVGGGRLKSIGADRVVIERAGGLLEVLLKDPAKPKAPPPAAPTAATVAPAPAGTPAPAGPAPAAAEARPPTAPAPTAPPSRGLTPEPRVNQR